MFLNLHTKFVHVHLPTDPQRTFYWTQAFHQLNPALTQNLFNHATAGFPLGLLALLARLSVCNQSANWRVIGCTASVCRSAQRPCGGVASRECVTSYRWVLLTRACRSNSLPITAITATPAHDVSWNDAVDETVCQREESAAWQQSYARINNCA